MLPPPKSVSKNTSVDPFICFCAGLNPHKYKAARAIRPELDFVDIWYTILSLQKSLNKE